MSRNFASQGADNVDFGNGAAILYNQTAASIMCWFRAPSAPTTGNWLGLFEQGAAFNEQAKIEMKTTNDADNGKFAVTWRSPAQFTTFVSTNAWDDGAWHRLLVVRRNSNPYTQIYIDGTSDGSQATDPGTDASTPTQHTWGYVPSVGSSSWGGDLARCAFVAGTTLTPQQADSFLYRAKPPVILGHWLEMVGYSPEPDWSGNANNGTVTGATIADHAPTSFLTIFPYRTYTVPVPILTTYGGYAQPVGPV